MADNDSHADDSHSIDRRTLLKSGATFGALTFAGVSIGSERSRAAPGGPDSGEGGEPVLYQYFHTGWSNIEADLPRLSDVGVDGIWVPQPARSKLDWEHQTTEDQEGYYGDHHSEYGYLEPHPPLGYQPVDLADFDSSFGAESELESLIDAAHARDIEVVLDTVLNHMATEDGPDGYVELPQFDRDEHFHDYGTLGEDCYWETEEYDEERATYECDLLGLPSFDHEHGHVQREQAAYIERMAALGADGLRYDAARHVWPWYFEHEINPLADDLGLWRVGEVWDGDKGVLLEFVNTGMRVFDFPLYYAIVDAFEGGDMTALSASEARGVVHDDPNAAVTFVQNHDTAGPNVGIEHENDDPSSYSEEGIEVQLAHAYILSYEGTPVIFLTEGSSADIDDPYLQDLIWVKRNLASGPAIDRYVDGDLYVFERQGNLLAGINNNAWEDRTEWVETSWTNEPLVDYAGDGAEVTTNDEGWVELTVPSQGWVMYAPEGHDGGNGDGELTLRVTVDVGYGESVYFTGNADELTNWGGGVEGTWTEGNVWEVTIDDPGEFEWKTRRGPSGASGNVWERGENHDHTDLHPEHQGWADE